MQVIIERTTKRFADLKPNEQCNICGIEWTRAAYSTLDGVTLHRETESGTHVISVPDGGNISESRTVKLNLLPIGSFFAVSGTAYVLLYYRMYSTACVMNLSVGKQEDIDTETYVTSLTPVSIQLKETP